MVLVRVYLSKDSKQASRANKYAGKAIPPRLRERRGKQMNGKKRANGRLDCPAAHFCPGFGNHRHPLTVSQSVSAVHSLRFTLQTKTDSSSQERVFFLSLLFFCFFLCLLFFFVSPPIPHPVPHSPSSPSSLSFPSLAHLSVFSLLSHPLPPFFTLYSPRTSPLHNRET